MTPPIGRRIFRQRLETGEREGDAEQRRKESISVITSCMLPVQAFMRLVYVSALVFGDASSFLLPWKRVLKVTDAQLFFINLMHGNLHGYVSKHVLTAINVENLVDLKKAQLSFKLSDELAEDLFREHTRRVVVENISSALSILKSRTLAA
ncbi:hypothetical protein ARALYDRAFT_887896 [Arabidopsis lyrata subsp. lyrata]|uniref:Uncharacterized protein n=1 Tax=Arabidopsis lyrata subsp. lyrata TaxID=81972 RepID=D7KG81_ARALL|nr:hypothetical protein ARALYDRAFT_887896 [Arabidopsis lyrata subsp. lyrata]